MNPEVFRAASAGNLSFFEEDSNCNLLEVTPEKNTVLHVALQFNQLEVAEKIVSLSPSLVSQKNSKDNTPLHVASRAGCSSIVKLLINEAKKENVEAGGAEQQLLSMVNKNRDTALHVAVRYCNFEVVKELINEKDPAELVNKAGESALFLAVERQRYDIASHILKKAQTCSYAGRDDMNVLHALAFCTSDCKCFSNLLLKYFSSSLLGSFVAGPL
nr:isoform 2 of protein accelerated cell death 6 [Quercus suber]